MMGGVDGNIYFYVMRDAVVTAVRRPSRLFQPGLHLRPVSAAPPADLADPRGHLLGVLDVHPAAREHLARALQLCGADPLLPGLEIPPAQAELQGRYRTQALEVAGLQSDLA